MIAKNLGKSEVEVLIGKVIDKMNSLDISIQEDTPASIISMDVWDWSQGVGLFSLYRYFRETRDEAVLAYLTSWFDQRIREGLPSKNVNTMCPLLTLSYLYEETGNADYLHLCEEWVSYAVYEMPRTPEFGITHVVVDNDNTGELWPDTLYMTVLFIARMGVLLDRDDYVQESIRQMLVHIKYLTDLESGLLYHGWTFMGGHHFARALWGRGNAWHMAGLVDYLDIVKLPIGVEMFLLSSLERQIQQLALLQSKNGLWHTLLDDPTSYEETSASAGFAYGILKAVRKGYVSEEFVETGKRALQAVSGQIDESGALHGVSYGTRMGRTLAFYKQIPQCPMPYGQSLALLMLVESLHLFKKTEKTAQ
ncbi:MAG: glycoside hydrolase family 88 protein [Paenibacillaceae bacterium]|uniref:beta-galactosidase BglB n=1 Tax=Paenibacillus cymbidii TaxID=1639034 RepID=UPI001B2546A1|nr:glycoside hydrolase family 88 protein [Paenibacillus cymbidii]MBO9609031.1 glycoside hydrolase family 88 protein [Paenibacillaceae bacterium]